MKHLEQNDLVLNYYREAAPSAAAHLASCDDCRRRFEDLSQLLSAIHAPEVPPRADDYGAQVWRQVRAHLPEKPAARSFWFPPRRWAAVGAIAVLVIAAYFAGRYTARPTAPTVAGRQVGQGILLVALGDHLDRSEMLLVELTHADSPADLDLAAERRQADDLIASNRLYRQAALRAGDNATVTVLDDLERVLLEVAHQPDGATSAELLQLRHQIEDHGLLFKVRVIQLNVKDEIRDRRIPLTPSQPRPTI